MVSLHCPTSRSHSFCRWQH